MSALCQKRTFRFYSITSSAVASSDCEKVRPSAFAAVKFSTSCNFVGRCTGSSAGLAPLRIWRGIRHEPAESPSPRHCAKPRGFLCVPPPDGGKSCCAVFWHQIGMAEAIPSRAAHIVIIPLRNDVVIPQQDAVECSRSRLEIGAMLGEDNLIDHGINRGVFDADTVE